MGPSVPGSFCRDGGWTKGMDDGLGVLLALERPAGARRGAFREDRGTRTGACTDISLLACTPKDAVKISAGWKSSSPCGKLAQLSAIGTGRLAPGPAADRGLPWPAAASEQPGFREAQI